MQDRGNRQLPETGSQQRSRATSLPLFLMTRHKAECSSPSCTRGTRDPPLGWEDSIPQSSHSQKELVSVDVPKALPRRQHLSYGYVGHAFTLTL